MLTNLKNSLTKVLPVVISSFSVTVLLFGMQRLGTFQYLELKVFDSMTQMRHDEGIDSRILIVEIDEEYVQKNKWPIPGEVLEQLFTKLEQYQPRAIGLDLFRDKQEDPGHQKFLDYVKSSDIIIPICKHSDALSPEIPPPQGTDINQVGFSEVIEDQME